MVADVLVVDDDEALRAMIAGALAGEGIPYRVARNGREAVERVAEQMPAVILLDMNMPVMDGVQFCQALQEGPGRDGCAIVVMTAAGQAARFRQMCAADDMLGKPFDLDDLYAVVERHLHVG